MPTLPMLSSEGWLDAPETILSRLFVHMFLTDYSQSNIYQGKVTSLQYILSQHGDDVPSLTEAVDRAVKNYVGRYFNSVEVAFRYVPPEDSETEAEMAFTLYIAGYIQGRKYDLNRAIQVDNSSGTQRFIAAFQ